MGSSKDRLLDHAYGPVADELRSLPPNLLRMYQEGLDSVRRGQAKALRPFNSEFLQTNLGHTNNMLNGLKRMEQEYPEITGGMNKPLIQRQIILHDGPEALPGACFIDEKTGQKFDVPAAGEERESPEGVRMKRREPKLFIWCILPKIPDEDIRARARIAYLRYAKRHPRDIETQMTKLLDGLEGTMETGLDGIFGIYQKYGYSLPPEYLISHLEETVPKTIAPFCNLARELPQPGRLALSDLLERNLNRLAQAGYDKLAHYAGILYQPLIRYPY